MYTNIKLKFSDIEESYVIGLIWWSPRSMFYHLFLCLFSNFMFSIFFLIFSNVFYCFLMLKKSYVIGLIWWRPPFYGFYRVRPFRDICLCKMGLPIGQKENEEKILITVLWEGFCASVVVLSFSSAMM